jgi:hypothetical protein
VVAPPQGIIDDAAEQGQVPDVKNLDKLTAEAAQGTKKMSCNGAGPEEMIAGSHGSNSVPLHELLLRSSRDDIDYDGGGGGDDDGDDDYHHGGIIDANGAYHRGPTVNHAANHRRACLIINSSLRQRQSGAASFLHFLNSCGGGGLDVKEPIDNCTLPRCKPIGLPNRPLNHDNKLSCALNCDNKISRVLNHDNQISCALNRASGINARRSSDPRPRRRITIRDDFAIYDINMEANCRRPLRDVPLSEGVRANYSSDNRHLGGSNGTTRLPMANSQAERYGIDSFSLADLSIIRMDCTVEADGCEVA